MRRVGDASADGDSTNRPLAQQLLLDEGEAARADLGARAQPVGGVLRIAHHTVGVDAGLAVRLDLSVKRQRTSLPDAALLRRERPVLHLCEGTYVVVSVRVCG